MVSSTGSPLPAQWVKIDAIAQMPEQCQFKAAQRGFWRTSGTCKRLNAVQVIEKEFREARLVYPVRGREVR